MNSYFFNREFLTFLSMERLRNSLISPNPFFKKYSSFLVHENLRVYFPSQVDLLHQQFQRKLGTFHYLGVELEAVLLDSSEKGLDISNHALVKKFTEELYSLEDWKRRLLFGHWELLGQKLEEIFLISWPIYLNTGKNNGMRRAGLEALEIPIMNEKLLILWEMYGPCQYNFFNLKDKRPQVMIMDSPQLVYYYHFLPKEELPYPKFDFELSMNSLIQNAKKFSINLSLSDFDIDSTKLNYI